MKIHYDQWNRDHPLIRPLLSTPPHLLAQVPGPLVPLLYAVGAYEGSGQQVYCLKRPQQDLFSDMDLGEMGIGELQFPYPGFYIAFEECPWTMRASHSAITGGFVEHRVQGAYVSATPYAPGTPFPIRTAPGEADGVSVVVWASHPKAGDLDDVLQALPVPTSQAGGTIEDYLLGRTPNNDPSISEEDGKHNFEVGLKVLRVVLGMVAYLQTREAETREYDPEPERRALRAKAQKGGSKGARAARRLTRLPKTRVRYVMPSLTRYQRPSVQSHWRSAHIRMVWVGPRTDADGNPQKGTHREPRFIPATVVNADGATTPRTYTFG